MITMDGKYQTRGGSPVRLVAIDQDSHQPVIGVIGSKKYVSQWFLDGRYVGEPGPGDLVPIPDPPKYIPYTDADRDLVRDKWIKRKCGGFECSINCFDVGLANGFGWGYLLENYTFLDGSVCGKFA